MDCIKSVIQKKELFAHNHYDSLNAAFDTEVETNVSNIVKENTHTSCMEAVEVKEKHSSGFQYGTEVEHNKFEGLSVEDEVSALSKGNKRPADASSFAQSSRKKHCSSKEPGAEKSSVNESRRQCGFLETAGRMKEVGSSPVFTSVFSFL